MSVGTVTDGHLVHGVPLPAPAQHLAVLPRQRRRNLRYGTAALVSALQRAAAAVARRYPGTVTYLGNVSAPGGGDIPWSVSHNSGRDADLAYFCTDPAGAPVEPPRLLPFDSLGWSFDDRGAYRLDVGRTWALLRALLEDEHVQVQFFFVYRPLQRLILEHAQRSGAPPEIVAAARERFLEPGGSAHNDHIHMRIHCTPQDLRHGCAEIGPRRPGAPDATAVVAERVRQVVRHVGAAGPQERYRAATLLGLLGDRSAGRALIGLVGDPEPAIRHATLRSLARLRVQAAAAPIAARLAEESDPAVLQQALVTLARLGGRAAERGLGQVCADLRWAAPPALRDYTRGFVAASSDASLRPPGDAPLESEGLFLPRADAARALATSSRAASVEALLVLLADSAAPVRAAARHALSRVLNHDLGADPARWRAWWRRHRRAPRRRWLDEGFSDAGFTVGERPGLDAVPELLRAVRGPGHISYNARRALAGILRGAHPQHLSWSAHDAQRFWARRYRRRVRHRRRSRRARHKG